MILLKSKLKLIKQIYFRLKMEILNSSNGSKDAHQNTFTNLELCILRLQSIHVSTQKGAIFLLNPLLTF